MKEKELEALQERCYKAEQERDIYKSQCEKNAERAEQAEELFNRAQGRIDRWIAKYHEADDLATERLNENSRKTTRICELEQEVLILKAKLYDLMTA